MAEAKNKRVFVAMSGGVDSSVTAALLKQQGYNVCGIHIKMWSDPEIPCHFKEDRYEAMRVAAVLDIPIKTWDLTREYKKEVVDYMVREFKAGRTPNPDVMCNKHIKFGVFLKKALERGADFVATGHYVRLQHQGIILSTFAEPVLEQSEGLSVNSVKDPMPTGRQVRDSSVAELTLSLSNGLSQNDNNFLLQAKDLNKDQSYFLWTLTQDQLKHCLFPIGDYIKPDVRKLAKKFKLPNADKKDSQGICFIGEINLREFLQKYIKSKPGKIITTGGKIVGDHIGLQFYTIGQRHGINVGGGIPFYVVKKDFKTNKLIVAEGPYDKKLFSKKLIATDINWISGTRPKFPLKCLARIRYRQPLQKCVIKLQLTTHMLQAVFATPQRAVTEGQSIVFYRGQEMLGGGVIAGD
ncbi:MAG: tRNA 2-thiouridine(34) synthase MnmA [Patescibacteria group bacterium]